MDSTREEVEVFFKNSASWVFQRSDRAYPSISIQGDSLLNAASQAQDVFRRIQAKQFDEDLEIEAEMLLDMLQGYASHLSAIWFAGRHLQSKTEGRIMRLLFLPSRPQALN